MNISYEQIEEYHAVIESVISSMKNIIDEIRETNNRIESSEVWTGEGASYYVKMFNSLLANFDEVYEKLKQSNIYLEQSSNNYKDIDSYILGSLNL